jgi:glycerol-3-phosphate dehydrogenase
MSTALNPAHRAASLKRMRDEVLDVLVVGGGVTGTGAAVDAASRGLSVGLIEARDYAAGASSKSSKLVHGGLRYLEMLDFGLVREALRERRLLLTTLAPHLVKPVAFIWPLTHRIWERQYLRAGLLLYDTMGGARAVPRARQLSRTAMLKVAPGLRPDAMIGGVRFYDAQEDDARMVAVLARTAAGLGAALATNVRMERVLTGTDLIGANLTGANLTGTGLTGTDLTGTDLTGTNLTGTNLTGTDTPPGTAAGDRRRVIGVAARDLLHGADLTIRARHVVVATGAWTGGDQLRVRPSKGVHITVPRGRIAMDSGLLMRTEKSVLFVIPWGDHWLIGDTDTEWPYDPAQPAASRADIAYLLAKVNGVLRDPLTAADVEGVFAGLRPLVAASAAADTTRLSREHTISSPAPGLSVIGGGKYTTYRVMARDLIDAAAADLGGVPASRTHALPLVGADQWEQHWAARLATAASSGLTSGQVERLLNRYGSCIDDLLDLMAARPDLAEPLTGAGGYLRAEVVYACTHEGAMHLEDVLARRTRTTIEVRDRGVTAAPDACDLMATELGWSPQRREYELASYLEWVAAQRAAEAQPDDESAYRALSGSTSRPALRCPEDGAAQPSADPLSRS